MTTQARSNLASNILRRLSAEGWTTEERVSHRGVTFHYLTRFDGSGTVQRAIVRELEGTGIGRLFFERI